jgi:poly(beta-D-mannuronate) lyase
MVTEIPIPNTDLDTSGIQRTRGPFTDIDDFLDAVNDAQEGDEIILANGSYDVSSNKDTKFSDRKGTATKPIIVRAQEVGKVTLEGSATRYKFENCKFFTWYGFNHTHPSSRENDNIFFDGGNNNRFARCEVKLDDKDNRSKRHWLKISNCKAMKVDHCFFHHKESEGQFCNVSFDGDNEHGEGPLFEYNYFLHQDYNKHVGDDNIGDAGGEAIQMGASQVCRFYFRGIFRYNYFEECNGDGEMITNKSSGNIYYNNSFTKTLGTMTLRHGDSTAMLGNYFEACGLRVGGAKNLIANNHFTKNSAKKDQRLPLVITSGDWELDPERPREEQQGAHWEHVVNNNIILNTFANGDGTAKFIVFWGMKQGPKMPTGNKFKGNIITAKNGKLLQFAEGVTASGNTISDNIGFITGSAIHADLSTSMATREDPLLTEDSDGIYRLQSGSPAHNKFQGMPFRELTTMDIDGEDRGPNTDAGCDQFSTASTKPKRRITPADVGPKATTDLGNSPVWDPQPINTGD